MGSAADKARGGRRVLEIIRGVDSQAHHCPCSLLVNRAEALPCSTSPAHSASKCTQLVGSLGARPVGTGLCQLGSLAPGRHQLCSAISLQGAVSQPLGPESLGQEVNNKGGIGEESISARGEHAPRGAEAVSNGHGPSHPQGASATPCCSPG